MASELDDDTALERGAGGAYHGAVTDRWGVLGGVPNGGFLMCYALRALIDATPQPDPLTMTAHFLRPGAVGPITVHTEVVKAGKRNATAVARVVQDQGEILRAIATFGQRAGEGAATILAGAPPPLPPLEDCLASAEGPLPEIARRFDNRVDPATFGWMRGEPSGDMVLRAYMRLADGREPDALSLPLFADGLPPPVFNALSPGWVPTVELTVHFRGSPVPGWLRAEFRTRFVSGGLLDEDGELWDQAGKLVALTRQLAILPRGPGAGGPR
jgi:acyl-CoA thioesterase